MNRRDMVMSLGTVGGLSVLNANSLLGSGLLASDQNSVRVLKEIRLAGAAEDQFLQRLGRQPAVAQPWPETAGTRTFRSTEAISIQQVDQAGQIVAIGLRFVCDARHINCFTVDSRPLSGRRFCYSVQNICWRPGVGFPVYNTYCPRYEYHPGTCYGAKMHQIVPLALNAGYFSGCQSSDVCQTSRAQLAFDVNDDDYSDNSGGYTVDLWSWS